MLQHARRIVLLAGLGAAATILAACRPVQVIPAQTLKPAATPVADLVALTVAKPEDMATLGVEDGSLLIDVESASGIGSASLAWTVAPTTPAVLRLHLGGLEELRLANGDVETVISVSSSPPHTVSQSTRSEQGAELQPITEGDPAWLGISWSAGGPAEVDAVTAAFPLRDGYFDIVLSDPRLAQAGSSLEIRWIDFYR